MKQTKLLLSLVLILSLLVQIAPVSAKEADEPSLKIADAFIIDHTVDSRGQVVELRGTSDNSNLPTTKAFDPSIYTDTEESIVQTIANVLLARDTKPFTVYHKTDRVLKRADILGWYYEAIASLPRYDQYCMTICYFSPAYYETSDGNYFDITYEIEYYLTPAQEAELDAKIVEILDMLDVYDKSDIDKLLATYEYLVRSVTYNLEAERCYTAYGALIDHECVCQGYALALMRLLLALDVDIDVVVGKSDDVNHMWNLIRLDGVEYLLDSTWDSGNRIPCYFWFLKGSENFPDHDPTDPYSANMSTSDHEKALELSHTWVFDETTQAHKCQLCSTVYPIADHRLVTDEAVPATCTESGRTEGKHCNLCDMIIVAQQIIPATGHSYDTHITESTCTADGVKTHTCSACGDSYTEVIPATGHNVVIDRAVSPTCTENGSTEGKHCDTCDAILVAQSIVPATGHTVVIDEAVAPTCLNSGITEGQHCSTCQAILVPQETVGRLGHDYGYTDNGNGTHTGACSRCDKTTTAVHSFTDGTCVCGAKEIVEPILDETIQIYHTLDLASDISISFVVPMSALTSYDSYYLECTLPEYKGIELTGISTVQIRPVVNGNYYYFTLTGITAVRMGDMVEAVLHMTKDGAAYISRTDTYSVATYAYAMLNSTSDTKMLSLCADLLRYGAEAQTYKKYRTDSLVDAAMTATHRSYLSNTEALIFTATDIFLRDLEAPMIHCVGKTLDLGSKVGMKFVFSTANYSGDIAKLSMKVSYTGSNGEAKTVTLTGAEAYNANAGYYSFTFYGLLASELRTIVDVAIYEGNTQLSETLRYSAETYASKTAGTALESLTRALFAYSDSARAYFTK